MPATDPSGGPGGPATTAVPTVPSGGALHANRGPLPSPASLTGQAAMTDLSRRGMGERPKSNYGRHAQSPIAYMAISLITAVVAIGVVRWALQPTSPRSRHGITPTWWDGIISVFVGSHHLLLTSRMDRPRLWWAVAAMAVATVLFVVWVRRLGQNARANAGFFGGLLVVAAFPLFWTLPLTIGGDIDSRGEFRLRATSALLLVIVQALFARWAMVHKLWRAGRIPYEGFAYLLWVPLTIATTWVLGATTWTAFSVEKDGTGHSGWEPTEGLFRVEMWATRATGLAVLILLIVVTVSQHIGIQEDEHIAEEWSTM